MGCFRVFAFGFGDCHAVAGSHSNQIGLELCDHAEDVEQQPADGILDRSAKAQSDALPCQLVSDITGVWKRSRQAVEFGDDKSVTGTHSGHRFAESRPGPVGAGKSVVNMDVFKGDTEGSEAFPLCGEVLAVGGNARISDFQCSH